jgi:hypothetical protein
MTAEDILQNLPEAVKLFRNDRKNVLKNYMPEVI